MHKALETEIRIALCNCPHESKITVNGRDLQVRTKDSIRHNARAISLTVKEAETIVFADTGDADVLLDRAFDVVTRRI